LNPYGYSKVLFDRWLESDPSSGAVGLKFFNVFGPQEYHEEDMASVVFKAFNQIQQTGTLKLFKSHRPDFKDGEQLRDFVYVKDITRWMIEVMNKPEIEGVFNMGFGKARSWLDLGNAVFAAMGKTPKYDWIEVPENIRNQYQYFTEAKMDKWLQADMSAPQWNLEKAVTDYVQNYLMKPDQYL
jgi:ADP-L-glycero-D-manno-heptose 6-epimerase